MKHWPGPIAVMSAMIIASACSNSDTAAPSLADPKDSATLATSANAISSEEATNIAKNRKRMSCLELTLAQSAPPPEQDASTDAPPSKGAQKTAADAAAAVPPQDLITAELACHCDGGHPISGYELYERRENLLRSAKYPNIREELAAYYPRDKKGGPRFLDNGEPMSDETLKKLPVVPLRAKTETCGPDCKAKREQANAKAVAEGQPKPFPDIDASGAAACAAPPGSKSASAAAKKAQ